MKILTPSKQALRHSWLSGKSATDHNLLPEIRAYMAKARLRRGVEIVKLSNRINDLKMQEDSGDDVSELDIPTDGLAAAVNSGLAPGGDGSQLSRARSPSVPGEKKSLSKIAKGAIFREVVLAKVREMKEQENALKVEAEAKEKDAKRRSFKGTE